eukprot:scaffold35157_cov61-Phaeocystis_antarctica.AAC.3
MIADIATKTGVMVLREIRSIRHSKPDERGDIVMSGNEMGSRKISTRTQGATAVAGLSGGGPDSLNIKVIIHCVIAQMQGRHLERERVNHERYQQREQPVGTLPRGVELGLPPALVRALAHHLRLTQTSGAVTEISRGVQREQ